MTCGHQRGAEKSIEASGQSLWASGKCFLATSMLLGLLKVIWSLKEVILGL